MADQGSEQSLATARRVDQLERRVDELAARLAALEAGAPYEGTSAAVPAVEQAAEPAPARGLLESVPALAGRTLVVLGGAFVVRSLTESGTLSAAAGVTLGIAYSLVWLWLADRAAARGQKLGGAFHALASALIVYPLLFEATTRLGLLSVAPAATLLVAANLAGLAVAWRRDFPGLAWIQQIFALGVAVALLFRTRAVVPFGLVLVCIAIASLILAYGRGWRGQRWLVAIGVDLVAALLGALWLVTRTPPEWLARGAVLTVQLGIVLVYLPAFASRLLFQERKVTAFAVVQSAIVLLVGFEGALAVATAPLRQAIAWGALVAALVLHAVLARRAEARVGHGAAVAYFATVATFLAAEAVRMLLPALAGAVWLAAATALAVLALSGRRPFLQAHAASLALAGAAISGLLLSSLAGLVLPARAETWPATRPWSITLLALVAAVAALLYRAAPPRKAEWLASISRLLALATALVAIAGQLARWLGAAFAAAPGAQANAGRLAVARTALLAVAALALTLAARRSGFRELSRLAAVVLVLGGLKLLLEDLRQGEAAHLVFSFVLYGGTLIAAPALRRRAAPSEEPPAG